jgi:YD repeat-containing protein
MKTIIAVSLILLSFSAYAYDHSYNVSGTDRSGGSIDGTVYSNNGERNVSGEITDEDGNTHSFDGQWDGYGHISGETDEGESVELDTN